MASVQICDWSKQIIQPGDPVYRIEVDGQAFEIGEQAKQAILGKLTGEISQAATPPPPVQQPSQEEGFIDQRSSSNPFDEGPGDAPAPQVQEVISQPPSLVEDNIIPDDPRQKFRRPSRSSVERVVAESKKFEQGTLSSLTPGRGRTEAQQKLLERDKEIAKRMQRGLPSDVKFRMNINKDDEN